MICVMDDTNFINSLSQITDIDVSLGLSRVEGDVFMYRATFSIFFNNLLKESNLLMSLLDENDITAFGTTVHTMKTMLSTIGAMELSETALDLELNAKKGEADYCQTNYPLLHQKLLVLNENLKPLFN